MGVELYCVGVCTNVGILPTKADYRKRTSCKKSFLVILVGSNLSKFGNYFCA